MKAIKALAVVLPCLLAACSTGPSLGDRSAKTVATGSAAGGSSEGANEQLERCPATLGTVTIVEEANQPWLVALRSQYQMQSTVPLLRLVIQQSNCFVIVERGQAMNIMQGERALMQSGDLRKTSNIGKGQMVAADYTISPSISISQQDTQGFKGLFGGRIGAVGSLLGGSMKANEAATMLLLTDNRSGIQLAAAEGSAKNWDFGMLGTLFNGGFGAGGGYSNTPQGKVLTAAFMDSYNQLVRAVRRYQKQSVEGGLGNGGVLKTN